MTNVLAYYVTATTLSTPSLSIMMFRIIADGKMTLITTKISDTQHSVTMLGFIFYCYSECQLCILAEYRVPNGLMFNVLIKHVLLLTMMALTVVLTTVKNVE